MDYFLIYHVCISQLQYYFKFTQFLQYQTQPITIIMTTIHSKSHLIDSLIQRQKQLFFKLAKFPHPLTSFKPKYSKYKQVMMNEPMGISSKEVVDRNPWNQINDSINEAKQQVNFIAMQPSEYSDAQQVHLNHRLNIQVEKNKLRKFKLESEKKKIEKQCQVEKARLDTLLSQLERVESSLKKQGLKIPENIGHSQSLTKDMPKQKDYPTIESLLALIPQASQSNQKYLSKITNSHYTYKPIEFFNELASDVMKTDRQIAFLQRKKLEEEEELQIIQNQYRKIQNSNQNMAQNLQKIREQEQKYKNQFDKLEYEIKYIKRPEYIEEELNQRIKTQKSIEEQDKKRMHIAILKLCKLIELSGNEQALQEAQDILETNGIVK